MKVCIMAPDRVFLDGEADELILPTNTGQIGILPNHTPLITGLDIGVLVVRQKTEWTPMALMGGFALVQENTITILVNEIELGKTIDSTTAEADFVAAQKAVDRAQGKKEAIEAALGLKRARARYQVTQTAL